MCRLQTAHIAFDRRHLFDPYVNWVLPSWCPHLIWLWESDGDGHAQCQTAGSGAENPPNSTVQTSRTTSFFDQGGKRTLLNAEPCHSSCRHNAGYQLGRNALHFIEKLPGFDLSPEDVIAFCRDQVAHFKCPREVRFGPIPKTSTGKLQKFNLRKTPHGGRGGPCYPEPWGSKVCAADRRGKAAALRCFKGAIGTNRVPN